MNNTSDTARDIVILANIVYIVTIVCKDDIEAAISIIFIFYNVHIEEDTRGDIQNKNVKKMSNCTPIHVQLPG